MPTFSVKVFGEKLALILDLMLAVQDKDSAFYHASAPVPLLGLFTTPTGESWYEADMLTRHYHALDISLRIALQNDADMQNIFTCDDSGAFLSTLDVRQMLQRRYALIDA